MQCELFVPSAGEEKTLGLKTFWWVYGRGGEIVDRYGYRMGREITPDRYYFGIYIGNEVDETRLDEFKLYSNKWDNLENSKIVEEYLTEGGWAKAHSTKQSIGKPVMIKGHKCINTLPFGTKCAVVYDLELEDMVIIPHYKFRLNKKTENLFNRVVSIYGELTEYYNVKIDVEWHDLNIFPCSEFASCVPAKYCIARGWQVNKILKYRDKNHKCNDVVEYIVIKVDDTETEKGRMFVVSNKWKYEEHEKIEPWMLEDNSFVQMWRAKNYSGRPCMINGHRCVIVYPFNVYNPVIWMVDTGAVFVMPSKAYPGNPYYDKIKEVFGKIPVYEH